MDKKAKKNLTLLREKVQKLQKQLSGAKQQDDEPGEVKRLEEEIAKLQGQIDELKKQ